MINPEDIFDLFDGESPDLTPDQKFDDKYVNFDRGRMLGSLIIRKVSDLIDTYKSFDNLGSPEAQARAKNKALGIYNKLLVSYLKRANHPDCIKGLAYEDAEPLSHILDTLTKHFERKEDYQTCTYLTKLKQDILYEDLTREFWLKEYEPLQ